MGAAHFEDAVYASDPCGHQDFGTNRSIVLRRRRHQDFGHFHNGGRNRIHDHRRGVDGCAARDVEADAGKRPNALAHIAAAFFTHLPARGNSLAVEFADAHGGLADRRAIRAIDLFTAFVPLFGRDFELAQARTVEFLDEAEERLVSALSNCGDDLGDVLLRRRAR